MSRRTKYDYLVGIREKREVSPSGQGAANFCENHRSGCPTWSIGQRFYNPGCRMCEEKAEKDPTLRTAPTVSELFRRHKESKRKSAAAFSREVAAKRAQRFARLGPLVFKGTTP